MGSIATQRDKCIAYTPLVILFAGSVVSCGVMVFFCLPVEKAWRPYLAGSCLDPAILDVVGKSMSGMQPVHSKIACADDSSVQRCYGLVLRLHSGSCPTTALSASETKVGSKRPDGWEHLVSP